MCHEDGGRESFQCLQVLYRSTTEMMSSPPVGGVLIFSTSVIKIPGKPYLTEISAEGILWDFLCYNEEER